MEKFIFINNNFEKDSKRQRGAKEKLIKLTNQQFQELSTDVYDELIRRTYNSRGNDNNDKMIVIYKNYKCNYI